MSRRKRKQKRSCLVINGQRIPIPAMRVQKGKGRKPRAFTELPIGGAEYRREYLGEWGTDEAQQKYDRVIAEWRANGQKPPAPKDPTETITVAQVVEAYWTWAKEYYRRPDGSPSKGLEDVRLALKPLKALYADLPATEFGPTKLITLREWMIHKNMEKSGEPLARKTVNSRTFIVRQVFRKAVEFELMGPEVVQRLDCVQNLRKGRSAAREPAPVKPVDPHLIDAVRPHVSRQVEALIDLQLLTGARPGELVGLCQADIDTTGDDWVVRLDQHKNSHRGKARELLFNSEAQAVLRKFMTPDRPLHAPLFSPTQAEAERRAELHKKRKTPLNQGNKPGKKTSHPRKSPPGETYTVTSYRRAIERGCHYYDGSGTGEQAYGTLSKHE